MNKCISSAVVSPSIFTHCSATLVSLYVVLCVRCDETEIMFPSTFMYLENIDYARATMSTTTVDEEEENMHAKIS